MAKVDYDVMNMEASVISPRIEDWSLTVFSPAGLGKTTLIHNMFKDKVRFFRFEKGTKAVVNKGIDINGDWQNVLNFVKECQRVVKEGKVLPFDVICWDTMDICADDVTAYIVKTEGEEVFTTEKNNKGYAMARKAVNEVVKQLEALGLYNIFLVHYAEKKIKRKLVDDYDVGQMSISGTFQKICYDLVDLCGVIISEKDDKGNLVRRLYFRHIDYDVKSRLSCMPDYIELGKSAQTGAENFMKVFQKAVEDEANLESNTSLPTETKPVKTPSSPVQTAPVKDKKPKPEVAPIQTFEESLDTEEIPDEDPMIQILQTRVANYYKAEVEAGRIDSKAAVRDRMELDFGVRKTSDIMDKEAMQSFLAPIMVSAMEEDDEL